MFGAGTLINAAAIVPGGLLGLLCGNHLQTILICACGLSVLLIGADGVFEKMLAVNGSALSSSGAMMLIVSLCLGGLAGELVGIAQATDRLGEWLKRKSGSSRDPNFVIGFVNASFTVSVGAMAVLGPIQDVLYGDLTTLLIKSVLDGVLVFAMAASYGKGCIFSVLPMVAIQGFFSLFAWLIEPVLTQAALHNISLVGSVLIFGIGVNLVFGPKIRVANFLPAWIFAAGWGLLSPM